MTRLTILHTNDVHGRVTQLSRIATLAGRTRREVTANGGHCVLWDAGDIEDPTLFESSMTKGSAAMAMLRGAGYDLAALGNASIIRYGPQCVRQLAERFGQPLLCANMFDASGQLIEGITPYSIQRFGPCTLAIIGLTDPMAAYSIFKLQPAEPAQILPQLIAEVRARGAITIILLSHLGSKRDQDVARQIDGIDLIIGAHDHVEFDPPIVVNHTLIAQAGDYGRWLGRIDLDIDPNTGRITQHQGKLIPVSEDIALDLETQAVYQAEQENVQQLTTQVIGELRSPIELVYDRQCAAGNLLADALLDRIKDAQIALTLSGHWATGLDAGPLTVGALYAANRSAANPARVELTGKQIVDFLQAAFKPENAQRQPKPLRGAPIGLPHIAGMTVYRNEGLLEVRVGDEPLQLDRTYITAGTDLEFSDIVDYLRVPDDRIEYEAPTIVTEVLEEYIAAHSPLSAPCGNRVLLK